MTKRETVSLLIKLIGIYCVVQVAPSLPAVLSIFPSIHNPIDIRMQVMGFALGLIIYAIWISICILVIRKSDWVASRVYKENSECTQLTSLGFQDIQTLGYNFIGLLLIVQSLPKIIGLLATIRMQYIQMSYGMQKGLASYIVPNISSFLTQFLIGVVLFLKPKGFANLWKKAQTMRYEKK